SHFPLMLRPPPPPTLFPYTTLFRSRAGRARMTRQKRDVELTAPVDPCRKGRLGYSARSEGRGEPFCSSRCRARHLSAAERIHWRSEEHTSELQSLRHLVCRLLLEKK